MGFKESVIYKLATIGRFSFAAAMVAFGAQRFIDLAKSGAAFPVAATMKRGRTGYRRLAIFLAFLLHFNLSAVMSFDEAYGRASDPIQQPTAQPSNVDKKAGNEKNVALLEPGALIKRELADGQQHIYQIRLSDDQFLKAIVEQDGIDVVARVSGPDGKQIAEFDSESRYQGQESVLLVAERAGEYRLIVQPKLKEGPQGHYKIWIDELRAATGNDRALQEARKMYDESLKLQRAAKYDEALPLCEKALAIRETILGSDHRDVAAAIYRLAHVYYYKGDYAKAEPLYQRALLTWEKALGSEHYQIAAPLHGLGILYAVTGEYAKAEPLFQRALMIWERVIGSENPSIAYFLNSLANLYTKKGDYARAEQLFQRALIIREKAFGPEHIELAGTINNLGSVYRERGDYAKVEALYQRSLSISEKALGPEHPNVAKSLDNLAGVYYEIGDYAKAEPLFKRALEIREKILGPEHPDVAETIGNLACLFAARGEIAKAEPLFQRSFAINERSLGPQHPLVGQSLNNLAELYRNRGEYAKAEPLGQRSLAIWEESLGPQHPLVAQALNNLSVLYASQRKIAQAIMFQSRANAVSEYNLAANLAIGSERQKLAYLALLSKQTGFTLSLHSQSARDDPEALNLAFTTLLRRKGRGLDAMTDTIAALRRHATPEGQALLDQLAEASSQLAALTFRESDAPKPDTYRARLKALEDKIETLEAALSACSAEFRSQAQPVTLAAVQAALPAGSVLIEFALRTPQDIQTGKNKPPHYLAYLLASQGQPRWVELGEAASIDSAVEAWREALRDPNRPDVKRLARAVDEKVMQPVRSSLKSELADTSHLLIAPDGSLNLIPFAALVDEQDQYLVRRYTISYLTSGRDLLRIKTSLPSKSAPLIVSNPAFGAVANVAARAAQDSRNMRAGNQGLKRIDRKQIFFRPLPGSQSEALALKVVLPEASVLLRKRATETALKQVRSPRILHVATHGFFLSDQEAPPALTTGFSNGHPTRSSDPRLNKWAAHVENPLLRSGLALAGANQNNGGGDDGMLTALEVAGLDLWGTKLVALSACDTGVGEVKNGEGVQGLRRALVLAGSESQLMSLWTVLDEKAKEVMVPYYKALLRGEGRGEALRQVQLRMLQSKDLRHPFYWAAFIQSGAWSNLKGRL